MSNTPNKPKEWVLYPQVNSNIITAIGPRPDENIKVVEHSALVAALEKIAGLEEELGLEQSKVVDAQKELSQAHAEIERLTNQYNEQLDLARHRAVELERANANRIAFKQTICDEHDDEQSREIERLDIKCGHASVEIAGLKAELERAKEEIEILAADNYHLKTECSPVHEYNALKVELERAHKQLSQYSVEAVGSTITVVNTRIKELETVIKDHVDRHCPKSYNQSACTWLHDYERLTAVLKQGEKK